MRTAIVWTRWLGMLLVMLCLVSPLQVEAAGLPGMSGGGSQEQQGPSPKELQASLDQVIGVLESEQQRSALLEQLRQLRQASREAASGEGKEAGGGLLGALASSLESGKGQDNGKALLTTWRDRAAAAWQDLRADFSSGRQWWSGLRDFALTLLAWAGMATLFYFLLRRVLHHYGLRLTLTDQPTALTMLRYCLRRVVPWGGAFGLTLAVTSWLESSPGMLLALTLGYATVCGMIFASVCEVVFAMFTWGHRRVALRILRRQAGWPLFAIGALGALGDATNSAIITRALGDDLAGFLSEFIGLCAILIAGAFIIRFKRPVRHLIRNRPYRLRRDQSLVSELLLVLGNIWHIPALLVVGASLIAVVSYSGDIRSDFARAILTAGLLVVMLIVGGLLYRSSQRAPERRRTRYGKRLIRFGYALAHLASWIVFAELAARIWGGSLLNASSGQLGERIILSLISVGVTLLVAWLVWIIADTAIHRAMTSTSRSQRGRARRARAETITPLLRNIVFATIVVIATIVALANLGVNVTPLLAGAGVIGLAVGFGAQTLVQDLITGIFILVEDTLAIDDFVDVGGNVGTVEKLSLRTVRLRDLDGIVHAVPFSQIKAVQNYSREFGYALFRIRVPHAMPIDDAIGMIQAVADEMREDALFRFKIWSALELQGIESFDQGAAIVRARFRTAPVMQWDVAREFNLRLKRRMDAAGVDLAMPRMSVTLENAEALRPARSEAEASSQPSARPRYRLRAGATLSSEELERAGIEERHGRATDAPGDSGAGDAPVTPHP
ncbi:small-conductance mechanosensitive channel [Kushneria sinocarnis]|uniref:Small-conductance mechanosensitive channel n=1 Tax=Kushneria sinocarnis TaxID=595502 RepID=A0A420WTN3_9GAMM|nr:mechanosensitive ion channel domain-containing protein [Kushneria sinocarnis]RKQ96888.1 small-conductance mechanosensitive channel [Kushneria sinocarnis]